MGSTFYGFEIGKSGLAASQHALNVTGNNIANADTKGYTRQRLNVSSIAAVMSLQRLASTEVAVGGGVRINSVEQVRDAFLDRQFREENSKTQYLETLTTGLDDLETMFDELSDTTSIRTTLSEFFASFQDLVNNSTDYEVRAQVRSKAIELTSSFNYYYAKLLDQQSVYDEQVYATVAKVNEIADSIGDLNEAIIAYEITGQSANDLRDQRNLLLDELSGLVDLTYSQDSVNGLTIEIDGRVLVNKGTVNHLATEQTGANPLNGVNDLNVVVWESDGAAVTVNGGSMKGLLQLRDGATQDEYGIAYLGGEINKLVSALVTQINAAHNLGWTMPCDENGNVSATGVDFFEDFGGLQPITAGNFSLSAALLLTPNNIAASDVEIAAYNEGNNENVKDIVAALNSNTIPGIETFQGFLTSTVSNLGIAASYNKNIYYMQSNLMSNKENSRIAVSGVSVDEEVTNLVRYQHAYAAAARVMTTMDEALDVMINKMGMVGR
jgi:flagellar hook-associated protein 1 FlgK